MESVRLLWTQVSADPVRQRRVGMLTLLLTEEGEFHISEEAVLKQVHFCTGSQVNVMATPLSRSFNDLL